MSNNILIAEQEECDVALVNGAKAFQYKDSDGNIQTVDLTSIKDATSLFENNQNIGVDWEVDLPLVNKAPNMFKGSNIKSFAAKLPNNTNSTYMFDGCENLEYTDINAPFTVMQRQAGISLSYSFKECISLKECKIERPVTLIRSDDGTV